MLDELHFGDEIGDLDQLVLRIAASQHHMRHRRLLLGKEVHHLAHVEIVVAQRDVDLVEQHHGFPCPDQRLGLVPGGLGGGHVALAARPADRASAPPTVPAARSARKARR